VGGSARSQPPRGTGPSGSIEFSHPMPPKPFTSGLVRLLSHALPFPSSACFLPDSREGACRYGSTIPRYYAAWPDGQGDTGLAHCG
jgi:hypothetical protein